MRFWAVVKKELRQIGRDRRTLMLVIFFPAMLLLLFGYALSFDVKNIRTGLLDLDMSEHSRDFAGSLAGSGYFKFVRNFLHRNEIDRGLDTGEVSAAVVIPQGFGRRIEAGEGAAVQALIDGSNAQMAVIIQGYLKAFAQDYSMGVLADYLSERAAAAGSASAGISLEPPILIEPRTWYNPELKSSMFLIPGMIVMILMLSCTISTSLSVVRERESGTMEQLLVSPLTSVQVIVGKTIPYVFISLMSASLILLIGDTVFGVCVKGDLLILYGALTLFIVCALSLGILISTVTTSLQVAYMVAALLSLLPSLLLSGFVFPIRNMSYPLQLLSYAVPARYFVEVIRSIVLKGTGVEAYWDELVALGVFSFVMLAAATVRMKRARLV